MVYEVRDALADNRAPRVTQIRPRIPQKNTARVTLEPSVAGIVLYAVIAQLPVSK